MSLKLPVNKFKCVEDLSEFNEDFIKFCHEKDNEVHFLEVDVNILKKERVEKGNHLQSKKLAANLPEKEIYIIHVRTQKQALNHGLFF